MPRRSFADFACSLARTLDIVGDAWTPLILRDVYLGVDTFNDIARDLGVSRALLTARLDLLVREEVVEQIPYREHPPRVRYALTERGRELVPILVALTQWGDRWTGDGAPPLLFTHDCGAPLNTAVTCAACAKAVEAEAIEAYPGPGGRRTVGTLVVAERMMGTGAHSDRRTSDRSGRDKSGWDRSG